MANGKNITNETYINREIEKLTKNIIDKYLTIILKDVFILVVLFIILFLIFNANIEKSIFFAIVLLVFYFIKFVYKLLSNHFMDDLSSIIYARKREFEIVEDIIEFIKLEKKVYIERDIRPRHYTPERSFVFNKIMFEKTKGNFMTNQHTDFKCGQKVQLWVTTNNTRKIIHVVSMDNIV